MKTYKTTTPRREETVAAIVVTYNRKHLLINCLKALFAQTRPLDSIILVDNASTDGTPIFLEESGVLGNPLIDYVRLPENTGGAGGFCEGMKRGYDKKYDWLWLMDDDGLPDEHCIEILLSHSASGAKQEIISPLVVSLENENELAFFLVDQRTGTRTRDVRVVKSCSVKGRIWGFANLFNGAMIGKDLIESIGYPRRDLFAWGDETEYFYRTKSRHFKVCTVTEAIFKHSQESAEKRLFFGKFAIPLFESRFKNYCHFRNYSFIHSSYRMYFTFSKSILKYVWYFIITTKLDIRGLVYYLRAVYDGVTRDFSKHKENWRQVVQPDGNIAENFVLQ